MLANYRHRRGMVELQKGWSGVAIEIVGQSVTVKMDRLPKDPVVVHVNNVESEAHHEETPIE